VGPEELGKKLRLILGREADAGIANVYAHESIISPNCHRDAALQQRVFVGVGDEIREDLRHPVLIGPTQPAAPPQDRA
jgi:hypothetical protein